MVTGGDTEVGTNGGIDAKMDPPLTTLEMKWNMANLSVVQRWAMCGPKSQKTQNFPPPTDGKGAVVDTTDIADGPGGGVSNWP